MRRTLGLALATAVLGACSSSTSTPPGVTTVTPITNSNGTPVTGILTARFDPTAGVLPFPINLLSQGSRDLTINAPISANASAGERALLTTLNALDGFSTSSPFTATFSAPLQASSIVAGQSVRFFQVEIVTSGPLTGTTTRVIRELAPGSEYVATVSTTNPAVLAVVPTKPLQQLSSYMVVVTKRVTDATGNDASPDTTYFLTQRTTPLATGFGTAACASADPLLPTANACALEPLRFVTNSQEAAAAAAGVNRSEIVLSWVANTQGVTPVLQAVRARVGQAAPAPVTVVNSGLTLAAIQQPPIADIYIGTIGLPYYLVAPGSGSPAAPASSVLTGFWRAAPGAYVAPFSALGLDSTSTNITFANPLPVLNSTQTVPVLMTLPNAASGRTKPDAGWPVVIFMHGVTRNRTDMLAISATMSQQGYAVIAIDQPLHGVGPTGSTAAFYIERTPFGPIASERTFDVDLINNSTGAPGPDGVIDSAGAHSINLASLLTSRDNLRQAVADLFTLTRAIPTIDTDGNGTADLDGSRIQFVGQSLGAITGVPFLALEPNVSSGVLSVPGGGIARMLNGSATFGPAIRAGLAANGVQAGTANFDQFLLITQTALDSGDPINYGTTLATTDNVLLHEVVGNASANPPVPSDQVIPNSVAGAPLSGTEPLIAALGLRTITQTTIDNNGVDGVVRFIAGDHGALLSPTASLAATTEMQRQMAIYIGGSITPPIPDRGRAVVVSNNAVIRTQ